MNNYAQMRLCTSSSLPPNNCNDACVYCDIDGLKGRNNTIRGSLPVTFCTPTTDNAQWIAFVAGTHYLTAEVSVTNCIKGDGLEMALFDGDGCSNLAVISSCFTDVNNNTKVRLVSVHILTIGKVYWLLIDGNNADVCNWEVNITNGSTKAPEFVDEGKMIIDEQVCLGVDIPLIYQPPIGATYFEWTLNGDSLSYKGKNLTLKLNQSGLYEICVTSSNNCHKAKSLCRKFEVLKPLLDSLNVSICANETYHFDSKEYGIGTHLIRKEQALTCDSIYILNIKKFNNQKLSSPFKMAEFTTTLGNEFELKALIDPLFDTLSILKSFLLNTTYPISAILAPTISDNLYLQWIDHNKCLNIDSIKITITYPSIIISPTLIKKHSQNNGALYLEVIDSNIYTINDIQIFDRWGSLIGTYVSNKADFLNTCPSCFSGTYTWRANISNNKGDKFIEGGVVVVVD